MSIKQLVPKPVKLGFAHLIKVQPRLPPSSLQQQIILAEAKLYGLNPQRLLFGVVEAPDPRFIRVGVGEAAEESDDLTDVWLFDFKTIANLRIKACHVMLATRGNPLTLHWRCLPGGKPWIVIEDLEWLQSTTKAVAHTTELCNLLDELSDCVKPAGGRPSGSGTPPHRRKELLDKAYQNISKTGATWNSEVIRGITHAAENTVLEWRKSFLKQTIPLIHRLHQEGLIYSEIAQKLDTTPDCLAMYMEDARRLKIG